MTYNRVLLGAVVAAALAAGGCGSSSHDGASAAKPSGKAAVQAPAKPAKPLTRAQYVRKADVLCGQARSISLQANKAVHAAFARHDANGAADAIDRYGPSFRDKVVALHALPLPRQGAKVVTTLLKVMDRQVMALEGESVALRNNDTQTLQAIAQAQTQSVSFAKTLGEAYGFRVCGR